MTDLRIPAEELFHIPQYPHDDKTLVRVLTLLPEHKFVHLVNRGPSHRSWVMLECVGEGCEGCTNEEKQARIRKSRYLWEFSTEHGARKLWAPKGLHEAIEAQKWTLGNDIFLSSEFLVWREIELLRGFPQFHFERVR